MARDPFVSTSTKRLDLTGDWEGQWVEVKEHLGVNDQKRISGSAFTSIKTATIDERNPQDAEAGVDLGRLYMTQLKVYLVDWSFADRQGKRVEVTGPAIDMLEPDLADEITARLNEWLEARKAQRAANPTSTTSSAQRSA